MADGRHIYKVVAIDRAGWESEPSQPADAVTDLTPPLTAITAPAGGSYVNGLVNIIGTAYSSNDFKEYPLYEGAGVTPSTWKLIQRSTVTIQQDILAQWDTLTLVEGSVYTLKLEAEDINGNLSSIKVTTTVDNRAPAMPTNLRATLSGSNVTLVWNANTESDLYGYLLFRDGHLANASGTSD